jgi:hypothetical protein
VKLFLFSVVADNRMIVGMLEKCCSSLGTSSCAEVDVKRENSASFADQYQRTVHAQNAQTQNQFKNSPGPPPVVVVKLEARDAGEVRRDTAGGGSPSVNDRRPSKSRKKSRSSRLVDSLTCCKQNHTWNDLSLFFFLISCQ